MDRMLDYTVQINEDGLRVEQFLRRRGYSRQNLVELKKMPLSILVNGSPRRLNEILTDMDTPVSYTHLTVIIAVSRFCIMTVLT